jgi:adenylate kinase
MKQRVIRIILLGAPGAGKGTQARRLCDAFGVPHIATGDMFRTAVSAGSPIGLAAKGFMDRGELVPDDVTIGVVEERLRMDDAKTGFIMDGFPRTAQQATALDALLAKLGWRLDAAVEFDVPREELLRRLTGRRVCANCQATYHVSFARPRTDGVCDRCGGGLIQRDDDSEATVARRLDVYQRQTAPLLAYYSGAGTLVKINGTASVDDVFAAVMAGVPVASTAVIL